MYGIHTALGRWTLHDLLNRWMESAFIAISFLPKLKIGRTVINWSLQNARELPSRCLKIAFKRPLLIVLHYESRIDWPMVSMMMTFFICNNHFGFTQQCVFVYIDAPVSSSHAEHISNTTGGPVSAIKLFLSFFVRPLCFFFSHSECAEQPTIWKKAMRLQMHETTSLIYLLEDSI